MCEPIVLHWDFNHEVFSCEWRYAEPSAGRTRSLVAEYVEQACSFRISIMRSSTRNGVVQSQASVGLEALSVNVYNNHALFRVLS